MDISIFKINENATVVSVSSYTIKLKERTLFEGYCSLQYAATSPWITEFQFRLSNDGTHYTKSYNMYVYQSQCQTLINETRNISFNLQVIRINFIVFAFIFVFRMSYDRKDLI